MKFLYRDKSFAIPTRIRFAFEKQVREQIVERGSVDYEIQALNRNGSISWARLRAELIDQQTNPRMVWTLEDITHERPLQENLKLAATVYQVSGAAMLIMDACYKILNINPAFTEITGFSLLEIEGKSIGGIYDFTFNQLTLEDISSSVNEAGYWRGELLICRKTEDRFPAMVLINCMKQQDGSISHYVALFLDISDHKQLEDELRHHAEIDPLTGLPNRKLFSQRLDIAFASAKRFNYNVALLYLDLDGFKQVNDRLGHGQGDRLLIKVAQCLACCVREVDTAARLGGDEFVVILNGTSREMIAVTAQRIVDMLTLTIRENSIELQVSASIGIALYPEDSTNPLTLLKYADAAMYKAKDNGKRQFCWHGNLAN